MGLSRRTSQERREGRNATDHTVKGQALLLTGWPGRGGRQAPRDTAGEESLLAPPLDRAVYSQGSSELTLT